MADINKAHRWLNEACLLAVALLNAAQPTGAPLLGTGIKHNMRHSWLCPHSTKSRTVADRQNPSVDQLVASRVLSGRTGQFMRHLKVPGNERGGNPQTLPGALALPGERKDFSNQRPYADPNVHRASANFYHDRGDTWSYGHAVQGIADPFYSSGIPRLGADDSVGPAPIPLTHAFNNGMEWDIKNLRYQLLKGRLNVPLVEEDRLFDISGGGNLFKLDLARWQLAATLYLMQCSGGEPGESNTQEGVLDFPLPIVSEDQRFALAGGGSFGVPGADDNVRWAQELPVSDWQRQRPLYQQPPQRAVGGR